ncbi:MAG TPA: hypothetical protein VNB64_00880 [Solirubrobacteraceae bacterium]|nr:hypothetical protein [Solirubrobacteraceae bacterium]
MNLGLAVTAACAWCAGGPFGAPADDRIYTLAGSRDVRLPVRAAEPEGARATEVELFSGLRVAAAPDGDVAVLEGEEARVRRLGRDGRVHTVAGRFPRGSRHRRPADDFEFPDGVPAAGRYLGSVVDVEAIGGGEFLILVSGPCKVRRVAPDGTVRSIAGTGRCAHYGDGGPASRAGLGYGRALARAPDGTLYVAEARRVRRIGPGGTVTTVAGTGMHGFAGDGGPARRARFRSIGGIDVSPDGTLLIADTSNHRIRRVSRTGRIDTVAGSARGFRGDGGPAVRARLDRPAAVAALPRGELAIADTENHRIRLVDRSGRIHTLAGSGVPGGRGDGGPALRAWMREPTDLDAAPNGDLVVGEPLNRVVRLIDRGRGTALAVAIVEGRVRAAEGRVSVTFALTRRASVVASIVGTRHRERTTGHSGRNRVSLPAVLPRGEYRVRLVARSGASEAAASVRLGVGSPAGALDELRGSFGAVRLGGPERAVSRSGGGVFEGPPWFEPDDPLAPPYRSVVTRPRTGARYVSLRTRGATYIAYERKVRAFLIRGEVRTSADVATGDPLDVARAEYGPNLRCGARAAGPYDIEPACAGRLAPNRHIWFAGDPIRAIGLGLRAFEWPPRAH